MFSIIIVFTLLIILLTSIFLISTQRRAILLEKQHIGLQWLKHLRILLSSIQQHRGLTTGYLNGDSSLLDRIQVLQQNINININNVNRVDEWISKNRNWTTITEHIQRLSKNFKTNSISNNLQQHNKLIRNILYIVEEMAEEHHMLDITPAANIDVEFIWKDLLETTEHMGQARAIGTGVAASGQCSSVEKIKLRYLTDKINHSGEELLNQLPNASNVASSIALLIDTIDKNFIAPNEEQPFISASEYFDIATSALDGIYQEYDNAHQNISNQLGAI